MDLAHGAPEPGGLWSAWHPEPLLVVGLLLLVATYWRGRSRAVAWRGWCFGGAVVALAVAVLSPLDALAHALASAHMVQHLLLTLVAAPLLALSAPSSALLRGGPSLLRAAVGYSRRGLPLLAAGAHVLRQPVVAWLLHVGTLWLWHSAVLYDAAVEHRWVHALEHAAFLVTGVLFWRVVVGTRAVRAWPGLGVLLLFTMALQSALLALLLTFAQEPWYLTYRTTTRPWGLEQLPDQRLAGAIMWVPAGFVYVGAALAVLVGWLRATAAADSEPRAPVPDLPGTPTAGGGGRGAGAGTAWPRPGTGPDVASRAAPAVGRVYLGEPGPRR